MNFHPPTLLLPLCKDWVLEDILNNTSTYNMVVVAKNS